MWAVVSVAIAGCLGMDHEVAGLGEAQLTRYQQMARDIEFPDVDEPIRVMPTLGATRDLLPPESQTPWPLTLEDAVQVGLQNSQIIRQNGQFLAPSNSLLDNPDFAPSIYDLPIQDNGVLFGARGLPAAISDYDPRVITGVQFGRDATVPNNTTLGLTPGETMTDNTLQTQARVEQPLMSGGTFSLFHNWEYDDGNLPSRLFGSAYTGALGLEFRQPLWAGAGKDYTSIAGPLAQRARGFSPINQGVVIALLNNKISQFDFESQLQNLVKEIGELYWDLYLAYREYDAEVKVRDLAERTWNEVKSKLGAGIEGGGAADEAQAADAYYDAQTRTEAALSNIYLTETRLRRLIGLTGDDGMLLKPTDTPESTDLRADRMAHLQNAFGNRLELKRQKTNIESLRLQWTAARSLVNPRVDFIADYRLNGFGKNLIARNTQDGITQEGFNSAYDSLFRGSEATWDIGIEVSVPVFLRAERAQLRQMEFKLAKAQAALASQEAEIAHELTYTFQTIQRWLAAVQSNRHRVAAANRRAEASRADYDAGRATLDLLLRAQANESQADVAYHRSLAEYNKALWDLQFRSGTILMRNRIMLKNALPVPALMSSR